MWIRPLRREKTVKVGGYERNIFEETIKCR